MGATLEILEKSTFDLLSVHVTWVLSGAIILVTCSLGSSKKALGGKQIKIAKSSNGKWSWVKYRYH